MNASAIYSKSGKGVQEAAGKTSHLSRPDRAVLSAIDGRATLAEVAQKVGKTFDPAFVKLVGDLDKGGFIREVSPGAPGAAPKPGAGAKPAAAAGKPAASMDPGSDLDFTSVLKIPKGKVAPPPQAPPKAAPPPPKPSAALPPAPPPPSAAQKVQAEKSAKEQQDAFAKAREEAEKKAQAERDRVKAETEAKLRAETEAKLRAEAEAKAKEAKAEADRKFAAELEAKAKAAREAEANKAREEAERVRREAEERAERIRKEAEEQAERIRKEAEEKLRREQEEMKRRLEEERRAREEAERKAKEEERRRREEEERREQAERAARRKREEEEEARERAERAARKKREEEEEARERAEREARRRAQAEAQAPPPPAQPKAQEAEPAKPAAPAPAQAGGGFSDSLLADLDSFTNRDEEERKEKEEAERKAKEAAAARAREEAERRAKEEAERREAEEKARRKQDEKERKAREEAELREAEEKEKARLREEEEKRKKEAEEREKKAKQEESLAARSQRQATFDAEQRAKREAALAASARPRAQAARLEKKGGWGKPIALTLFFLLLVGVGVAHVLPIDVSDYQRAATDAFGREVRIGSANLSLVTGLQLKFGNVKIGEAAPIPEVRAFPELDALLGPRKAFSRIEIDAMKLEQQAVGGALFAKLKADNFSVGRVTVKKLELSGPLALPKGLEVDVIYDREGAVSSAVVRGPEALLAKLTPKGSAIEIEMSASTFTVPFAPEVSMSRFSLKGTTTPQGLSVSEWDGQLLNGSVSGNANLRWGDLWVLDGVLTVRNINAAVFAPALLSEGRGEASGKFSMRGADPGKLGESARIDGSFTVTRGVLGSIDLSRAIQTGGKQATGRTTFNEMNGNAVYERGAVALRNVTISAGQLNAGASADITPSGALSGRIVADVKVASQQLRATLNLTGTLKDPQVKN
jgi:hypothetical protein